MRTKRMIVGAAILTVAITVVSFVIYDRPDKTYLNPIHVDILVLCAGVFLLTDAWKRARGPDLASPLLTAVIGAAIVTIHVLQFAFDLARHRL